MHPFWVFLITLLLIIKPPIIIIVVNIIKRIFFISYHPKKSKILLATLVSLLISIWLNRFDLRSNCLLKMILFPDIHQKVYHFLHNNQEDLPLLDFCLLHLKQISYYSPFAPVSRPRASLTVRSPFFPVLNRSHRIIPVSATTKSFIDFPILPIPPGISFIEYDYYIRNYPGILIIRNPVIF